MILCGSSAILKSQYLIYAFKGVAHMTVRNRKLWGIKKKKMSGHPEEGSTHSNILSLSIGFIL